MEVAELRSRVLAVNHKFYEMQKTVPDFTKLRILEGVMLLDEYRLYQWFVADRPASYIVDIGGHYGSFTAMAKTLWPAATVLAYEPTPNSAAQYRENTAEFDHVTLVEAATMGRPLAGDTIPLYLSPEGNDGGNSTGANATRPAIDVRAISLVEDLNARGRPNISIMKMDCEGAEVGLLQDLSDNGYLFQIGFIPGEWHGRKNQETIKAILEPTHIVEMLDNEHGNGAFFAWRR